MTFSDSGSFICNVCGAICPKSAGPPGREVASCACNSTVRLRGLVAALSNEIFGVPLALPDFPAMKGLRGFGMSDPLNLSQQLEKKFDYTNTFYHQPPTIDITKPADTEWGRYDFIVSSEVMEHVPPPVENAFANLYRLLKPNGVLLLTVPYGLDEKTKEHFPELNEYALASPGGKTVLVNRRRDGSTEVFENLCFHGGDGSTLELRVYSEASLKSILLGAGFTDVRIASENIPEFGVDHAETWSLPIVARKGKLQASITEVAQAYTESLRRGEELARELASIQSEYQRHIAFHKESHAELERVLAERSEWVKRTEAVAEERTKWAHSLDKDYKELLAHFERLKAEGEAAAEARAALEAQRWVRLGRKLGQL
ncbi:MAG: methyltransferase domain-containing protein [Bryobacteraceae bacterium]